MAKRLDDAFEKLAKTDSDIEVREAAIIALGTSFAGTQDKRVGFLLAAIVDDDRQPSRTRLTAFTSLLRLHGNLNYLGASPLVPLEINEIDWAFVAEYLDPT